MKENEYSAAEGVEIGKPEEIILGQKNTTPALDSIIEPFDRVYVE